MNTKIVINYHDEDLTMPELTIVPRVGENLDLYCLFDVDRYIIELEKYGVSELTVLSILHDWSHDEHVIKLFVR